MKVVLLPAITVRLCGSCAMSGGACTERRAGPPSATPHWFATSTE